MSVFDYYLVVDFEASGVVARSSEWEIVEFPIVVVDAQAVRRLPNEFHCFVRPTVNTLLSEQCMQNCGIEQAAVDAASPIGVVVEEAIAWVESTCSGTTVAVVTCGDYDLGTALRVESERKAFSLPIWLRRWVNIKVAFESCFGYKTGMKGMLSHLGLPLNGRHHCGLDDSRNIANIVVELLKLGKTLELTGNYAPESSDSFSHKLRSTPHDKIPQGAPSARPRRWGRHTGTSTTVENAGPAADMQTTGCDSGPAADTGAGYSKGKSAKSDGTPPCDQDTGPVHDTSCAGKGGNSGKGSKGSNKTRSPVHIAEPWLSWLVSGVKTHEGRLCRGTWAKLTPGDHLVAFSDRYAHVDLIVRNILHFEDFDGAFESLGKRLVPEGAETPLEALQLYRQWNSADAVRECGGVVAVEVEVREARLR